MSLREQLFVAIKSGDDNQKVSDVLHKMSAGQVNEQSATGLTALHMACSRAKNHVVDLLLSKPGINVNAKSQGNGSTPLHVACWKDNCVAVFDLFYMPGINKNAQDNSGKTPIMVAAVNCSMESLRLLLVSSHVDLDIKDSAGRGLEDLVGVGLVSKSEEVKIKKCLVMIKKERLKRKQESVNEMQIKVKESKMRSKEKVIIREHTDVLPECEQSVNYQRRCQLLESQLVTEQNKAICLGSQLVDNVKYTEQKLCEADRRVKMLELEIDRLQAKTEESSKMVKTHGEEVKNQKEALKSAEVKVSELMNQVKYAREKNDIGEERLEQQENQIQMLTRELKSTKRKLEEKEIAFNKFQKRLAKEVGELLMMVSTLF